MEPMMTDLPVERLAQTTQRTTSAPLLMQCVVVGAIVVGSLAVRLAYMGTGPFDHDERVYCIAALKYHVAHPPGYFGYVALGAALNSFVHHINLTFENISLVSALIATVLVYCLARGMGLSWRAAAVAAVVYSVSLNTMYYSVVAVNMVVEGMFVALFALLAVRAIGGARAGAAAVERGASGGARSTATFWATAAFWATAVFALAGAIRPTTTMFLLPLWLYMLWRLRPRAGAVIGHLAIAVPIVLGCMEINRYLMQRAGFQTQTFSARVMMPASYDYASFSTATTHAAVAQPSYQLPAFELLAWVHDLLHLHVLPTGSTWPTPSLKHAMELAAKQTCKLAFYAIWSAPLLLMVPLVWAKRHRTAGKRWRSGRVGQIWATVPPWQRRFYFWWIAPASLFFIFGHMGTPGYIQVFLPGLCVLLCTYLLADWGPDGVGWGQARTWAVLMRRLAPTLLLPLAGLVFFVGARPFDPSATGWRGAANLLLLQYTGTGIREEIALARSTPWPPSPEIQAMIDAKTDQEMIKAAKKVDLLPVPKEK